MRMIGKLLTSALTAVLAVSLFAAPAFAAVETDKGASQTYRITLHSGNQGVITAAPGWSLADGVATKDVAYGDAVDFGGIQVSVHDGSKYYVKGLRPAEQNNGYMKYYVALPGSNGALANASAAVADKDKDYVVAYGLNSQRVKYTVRFVDANGVEIADPVDYIGNVGDEVAPVASYIDGYVPNVVMQTKTLGTDESQNVIAFTYRNVPGVRTIQLPGNVIQVITPGGAVATVTPEEADEEGATPEVVADDGTVILDDEGTPLAAPVDEVSLDDDETPLAESGALEGADAPGEAAADGANPLSWMLPLLLICVAAGLIVFFALMVRGRRKSEGKAE